MRSVDPYEALVRRHISPETADRLLAGLRLAQILRQNPDQGAVIPFSEMSGTDLLSGLMPFRSLVEIEKLDGEFVLRRTASGCEVEDLAEANDEDRERLKDFGSEFFVLNGYVPNIKDFLVMAPSADPAEALAWCQAAINFDLDDLSSERALPVIDEIEIGGKCPVQADLTAFGTPFYYRSRGEHQTLEVRDGDLVMKERVPGGEFAAGWVEQKDSLSFIRRALASYSRILNASPELG